MKSLSYKVHTLQSLSFRLFLEALINRDLNVLLVSGEATDEALQSEWQALHLQFMDACLTEGDSSLNAESQYYYYEIQIKRIQALIDAASTTYQPAILELLREDGFNFAFTEESYLDDLKAVTGQCQRFVILRNEYACQLGSSEYGDKEKISYEYFASVLNAISTMVKYNVSDDISTLRYCIYYKQLITHIERQEQERLS